MDLAGATVEGHLDLSDATVAGFLNMNRLQVGQDLLMSKSKTSFLLMDKGAEYKPSFQDVALAYATVKGHLNLSGATVAGTLVLTGATVEGHLGLRDTTVADTLSLAGATIERDLDMSGATVAGTLYLMEGTVEGNLALSGATVAGTLDMQYLRVRRDLLMGEDAKFKESVRLIFARIGANLDLSRANFTVLDLSATRIEGELRLDPAPRLAPAHLNLRNAHAGVLHVEWAPSSPPPDPGWVWRLVRKVLGRDLEANDRTHAWPGELVLELEGFTYDRLGGFAVGDDRPSRGMLDRDISWYTDQKKGWLAHDRSYSPQPYVQLADTFRKAGEPEKADQVLYAGRERAREEARGWPRWLWLSALKWTIGYGIGLGYFRAFYWVAGFALFGAILVSYGQSHGLVTYSKPSESQTNTSPSAANSHVGHSAEGMLDSTISRVAYSLDELLPIVVLDRTHDKVELAGSVRYYFMLHRLLGFVLGGFIVAGLGGLTQK